MDVHSRTTELIAASVLDACDADEVEAVEDHLRECATCAAEARRLRSAAALFGTERVAAPPAQLRQAVLTRAREARPPSPFRALTEAFAAQVAHLDRLLVALDPHDWRRVDPRHGDLRGVVAHLTGNDAMLAADLGLRVVAVPEGPGQLVRDAWREQADVLLQGLPAVAERKVALDRQVRLAGRGGPQPGPLRHALVQRAFETWTHLDDVGTIVGRSRPVPSAEQVRRIVDLAVELLPGALREHDVVRPDRLGRLVLSGAGGGEWTFPLGHRSPASATNVTIAAEAVEFARLVANRRSAETLQHSVTGEQALAAQLLRIAATLGCD